MDFELQMVLLPVADVDRAKDFYAQRMGFTLDVDHRAGEQFRVVQFTPPGSACSISFGTGLGGVSQSPVVGLHLVVRDISSAREELVGRGAEVAEIRHMTADGWAPGADPAHAKYNSFAEVVDPDGNTWLLQEVP